MTCSVFLYLFLITDPAPKVDPVFLTAPKTMTVALGNKILIEVKTNAKKVTWKVPFGVDYEAIDSGKRLACWASEGTYRLLASIPKGEDVLHSETVLIVTGPRPPPVPPVPPTPPIPPDPVPPTPPQPVPVTSFRVIFVTESSVQLSPQQTAVSGAKSVRDYLNAKTTPDKMANGQSWAGWREFDPQIVASNEYPGIKGVWDAAKPKITTVPCLVVQVNDKIDILPYPKNASECLTTLQSYGGK